MGADESSDVTRADAFLNKYGEKIRYSPDMGIWHTWDGKRWKPDTMNQVGTWAQQSGITGNLPLQKRMAEQAGLSPLIKVPADGWDPDPWALACENVTIDLRTGTVSAPDPAALNTRLAPVQFIPGAQCPVFDAFMDRIMAGNKVMIGYLQRLLGYSMTGSVRDAIMPVFIGEGANGKSTLLKVVQDVMGEYSGTASEGLLLAKSYEGHPTALAALMGKRLVVSSEIPPGRKLDVARVKGLSGGDKIKARYMRQDEFEFEATHKLILQCNHLPRLGDATNGIWRRIQRIEFPVVIPEHEQDRSLGEKLAAEHSGILNWLVAGAAQWYAGGLRVPPEVSEATEVYRRDDDVNAEFFDTELTFGNGRESSADLRRAYDRWAEGRVAYGDRLTVHDLAAQIRQRGAVRTKWDSGRIKGWKGVAVVERTGAMAGPPEF